MRKAKMPLAYSYIRFSNPQQADGDTLSRQIDNRESWLAAHPGVELDRSLKMTDAGRSAFRRKDWDTYALARFVEHVKSGRVEPGSFLLVENLDRLSREDAGTATELFLSIVNRGVVVVQLSPVVMEFRKPVNVQSLMFAIVELSRGNSESAAKSERVGAAWARKHKDIRSKVLTRRVPSWIDYKDGKLMLNPDKAKVVRRIFELARAGLGMAAIAKRLNAERVPVLGRTTMRQKGTGEPRAVAWRSTTVHYILTSRAAVGDFVPYRCRTAGRKPMGEPVPGYFPPVVDADTFDAVRGLLALRGRVGRGRRGNHVNLFAGLLRDARGGALTYRHQRAMPARLVPLDAEQGRRDQWVCFQADVFESALIDQLSEVKAADIGGTGDAARKVEAVAGRVAEVDDLIRQWTAKMDDPAIVDTVAAKLSELHGRRRALAEQLADAQRKAASPLAESWGEFRSLAGLLAEDKSDEFRLKVRAAIRRTISSVVCLFMPGGKVRLAAVQVFFNDTGVSRLYIIRHQPRVGRGKQTSFGAWSGLFDQAGVAEPFDLRRADDALIIENILKSYNPATGEFDPKAIDAAYGL